MRSRVELFETIRRQHRDEGLSIRVLAERHQVHRRTVRQALASAVPPPRKTPVRASPALGAHEATIRAWLVADEQAPPKQRHTARQVWRRLRGEHGAVVGESTVRRFVAQVRAERAAAARQQVTIPQAHLPGEEAEVDFGEIYAQVAGVAVRLYLFVLRLSYSGRSFAMAYAHQAQEAFFDGHVRAFAHFGGVPAGRVRYDNLKPAVVRILRGRDRVENERFVMLRSHYGFDSFFCEPGIAGAHEKGGVEGEVGRFRRTHLVPVPEVDTLAELNALIAEATAADDSRRIAARPDTIAQAFGVEQARLHPLPAEPFDAARLLSCKADAKARISVLGAHYSVPARLAGRRLTARLGAHQLEVLLDAKVVAVHPRSLHKHTQHLVLDHYLEVLVRKPGALPGATALAQAREQGAFTPTHDAFWTACRRKHGDAKGTRALIEVLLAHRHLPAATLIQAMRQAVDAGVTDPAVVVVEARRIADRLSPAEVIPIGALARFDRPKPALASYDTLLDEQAGGHLDHLDGRDQLGERDPDVAERAHRRPHLEVVGAQADVEQSAGTQTEAEGVGA
jgi:transposase